MEYRGVDLADQQLVGSIVLQSIESLVSEVLQERDLGNGELQFLLNILESSSGILNILHGDTTCTLVEHHGSASRGVSIDNVDLGQSCCLDVFSFLSDFLHGSQLIIGGLLLVGNFCGNDGPLVNIRQVNLKKHEATDVGVCLI